MIDIRVIYHLVTGEHPPAEKKAREALRMRARVLGDSQLLALVNQEEGRTISIKPPSTGEYK